MKRRLFILAIFAAAALGSGCDLVWEDECASCTHDFQVHINSGFEDDQVEIFIDDARVFAGRVTTDYILGLAEVVELTRPEGTHTITVILNGSAEEEVTFELDQTLFIHVMYFRKPLPEQGLPAGLRIWVSEHQPLYD